MGVGVGVIEGGAHKPQSTLSCHQCLEAMHGFETDIRSTNLSFCIYEDRTGMEVVWMNPPDGETVLLPWGIRPVFDTPNRWKKKKKKKTSGDSANKEAF